MESMDHPAAYWLSLPDHKAFEIFKGPSAQLRKSYRRLVQHWHPDRNADPHADEVLIRIQKLYRLASASSSNLDHTIELTDSQGKRFRYQFYFQQDFELGQFHRARASFAYRIQNQHKLLFDRFVHRHAAFGFADNKMRQAFEPLLPCPAGSVWGPEGGLLVLRLPQGFIRLSDLLAYHQLRHPGTGLDPLHVAWMVSGLFNMACYLTHSRLTHNAISLDTVWVNPEKHDVALLGGWFFSQPVGGRIDILPASSVSQASSRFLSNKTATPAFDMDLIRGVGRTLLGDYTGSRLISLGAPRQMVDFLLSASSDCAVEDYRAWKQVLLACFGPPKFVPMNVSSNDIYKENDNG